MTTPSLLTFTISNPNPAINQSFVFGGALTDNEGNPEWGSRVITVYKIVTGSNDVIGTVSTDSNSSTYQFLWSESSYGNFTYYAYFAGDDVYSAVTSETILVSIPEPVVVQTTPLISDYTFELHSWNWTNKSTDNPFGTAEYLGTLDKRTVPYLSRELGLADSLTFNLPLDDPKYLWFLDNPPGNTIGLEVWYYGRDKNLKQVFVPVSDEPYRDYGATSTGSGSGSLGSGSGDWALITCDGPESYLTRYITQNYKVSQRLVSDILMDITAEIRADGLIYYCNVDPSLNMLLDIDLSWENLQTAVGNIITQVGGYMQVQMEYGNPLHRDINLMPIPGQLPQPTDTGTTSAVLPQ